eukprot:COSAG01_NODE_16405_length_1239_cov_1.161404_2_plen_140_part_00
MRAPADWFEDYFDEHWSLFAARLAGAAAVGGPDTAFGAYVVPRSSAGWGFQMRVHALLGHGAKAIKYFAFGPVRASWLGGSASLTSHLSRMWYSSFALTDVDGRLANAYGAGVGLSRKLLGRRRPRLRPVDDQLAHDGS